MQYSIAFLITLISSHYILAGAEEIPKCEYFSSTCTLCDKDQVCQCIGKNSTVTLPCAEKNETSGQGYLQLTSNNEQGSASLICPTDQLFVNEQHNPAAPKFCKCSDELEEIIPFENCPEIQYKINLPPVICPSIPPCPVAPTPPPITCPTLATTTPRPTTSPPPPPPTPACNCNCTYVFPSTTPQPTTVTEKSYPKTTPEIFTPPPIVWPTCFNACKVVDENATSSCPDPTPAPSFPVNLGFMEWKVTPEITFWMLVGIIILLSLNSLMLVIALCKKGCARGGGVILSSAKPRVSNVVRMSAYRRPNAIPQEGVEMDDYDRF